LQRDYALEFPLFGAANQRRRDPGSSRKQDASNCTSRRCREASALVLELLAPALAVNELGCGAYSFAAVILQDIER
jgi:hypothetical protein